MDERHGIDRRDSVDWAARVALAQWMRRVGDPGLAALRSDPALLARVDQHAAEVRDTLMDDDGRVPMVALAAYADGVGDVAAARGCHLAELAGAAAWSRPPWALVRMVAVCMLAGAAGDLLG